MLKGAQLWSKHTVDAALARGRAGFGSLEGHGVRLGEFHLAAAGVQRFRGTLIDVVTKSRLERFGIDKLLGIKTVGRGRLGPDLVNPRTGTAWDITKPWLVNAHKAKYVGYSYPIGGRLVTVNRLIGLTYQ